MHKHVKHCIAHPLSGVKNEWTPQYYPWTCSLSLCCKKEALKNVNVIKLLLLPPTLSIPFECNRKPAGTIRRLSRLACSPGETSPSKAVKVAGRKLLVLFLFLTFNSTNWQIGSHPVNKLAPIQTITTTSKNDMLPNICLLTFHQGIGRHIMGEVLITFRVLLLLYFIWNVGVCM